MAHKVWKSPFYRGTTKGSKKFTVDVTQSISAGLSGNAGLVEHLVPWMKERGFTRILDFGAGALRHTLPLLDQGFEVTAVEFKEAFSRPKANKNLEIARTKDGFSELIWPKDFINSSQRFDVILLIFVLQVVPNKSDRERILDEIRKKLDKNGPKRLYYASRFGEGSRLKDEDKFRDGWILGFKNLTQSFYTEWNAATTHKMMRRKHFIPAGNYSGASQPFIYELEAGL